MIAYKWVIKKDDKYYSLMSYGIDSWIKEKPIIEYQLNIIYNNCQDLSNKPVNFRYDRAFEGQPYYHFWRTPHINSPEWNRYNHYLINHIKTANTGINAILKCEVEDIINCNEIRITAKKFKPIEEIKIADLCIFA